MFRSCGVASRSNLAAHSHLERCLPRFPARPRTSASKDIPAHKGTATLRDGSGYRRTLYCSGYRERAHNGLDEAGASTSASQQDFNESLAAPKRRARASKSNGSKQQTLKLEDLPTHAIDANGQPLKPLLPAERLSSKKGGRGKGVSQAAVSKERENSTMTGYSESNEINDSLSNSSSSQEHPRLNELGPDGQGWPPLAKDVLRNMARFSSCVLLTRVGGFYESYFEQAPVLASLLGIKLASRTWGGRTVPMAGFPIVQVEKYLKILVMDHRRLVAMCDEFKEIQSSSGKFGEAGGIQRKSLSGTAAQRMQSPFAPSLNTRLDHSESIAITRRVTRVVSPGTLIDEAFLDPFASNWILSIAKVGESFGVAWLDVSTADFHTTMCSDEQSLRDEVARIAPSEIVLEDHAFVQESVSSPLVKDSTPGMTHFRALRTGDAGLPMPFVPDNSPLWEAVDPADVHISFIKPSTSSGTGTGTGIDDAETAAVANLTSHLKTRLIDININDVEDLTGLNGGAERRRRDQVLTMDASTLSALEINASMWKDEQSFNPLSTNLSTRGSLLSHIRRTVTKGGARLLAQWLTAPSTSLPTITRRQSLVALFLSHSAFMTEDLRNMLRRRAGDINRALQRIITSRNDEQDLLEVRDFIQLCNDFVKQIKQEISHHREEERGAARYANQDGWTALEAVVNAFEDLSGLGQRLGEAIDEGVMEKRLRAQEDREREMAGNLLSDARAASGDEKTVRSRRKSSELGDQDEDGDVGQKLWGPDFEHLIRPGSSPQLSALTREHTLLRRKAHRLEIDLRNRFSDRLSLRYLLGQGYVVHLADVRDTMQKALGIMESEMSLAYKSKTTRTFYHEQFTRIGSRLSRVELELQDKEAIELQRLRLDVLVELGRLRRNASMIHELDVLFGFATLAGELKLVRPMVHEGQGLSIKDGRHIGVELALLHQRQQVQFQFGDAPIKDLVVSRRFTPNDVVIGDTSKLHLISGPNMGGKSTLLRMVAIIAILAQTGCFVPAAECEIGIIDQIFSRIGAHDAIHADKSTFMIEMLEVGQFLRRSTNRSLVLCDEVGRGTDHLTGIAIAHATAKHLVENIGCKCLFATHLHDVGEMLSDTPGVELYCTDLEETEQHDIMFSHKLRPGLNRKSHGLTIARLANLPDEVLSQAKETLVHLQDEESARKGVPAPARSREEV